MMLNKSTGTLKKLLPIGSTLDNGRGIFYWQPCAGFLVHYRFVFAEKAAGGQVTKKLEVSKHGDYLKILTKRGKRAYLFAQPCQLLFLPGKKILYCRRGNMKFY
jgi:hypothetical protein